MYSLESLWSAFGKGKFFDLTNGALAHVLLDYGEVGVLMPWVLKRV